MSGRAGLLAALVLAWLTACAAPVAPASPVSMPDAPPGFAAALARALPYTVGVYPLDVDADAPAAAQGLLGAGIVLRADGLVATAAHVVAGVSRAAVRLADDRVFIGRVAGRDEVTDIAVLRIDERWPAEPPLGHSAVLARGDWVLAVGEPFGLQRTVVAGIVGGPARHFIEDREVLFIQTDLMLNPGHSGGPLLDPRGAIVGMNARAIAGTYGMAGMGLTVPIEVVLEVAAALEAGTARQGFGATFEDLLPPQALQVGLPRASGAVVRSVEPGSLAQRLGLRAGDIVVGLDGQPVGDGADLVRLLRDRTAAAPLRAVVYRRDGYEELRLAAP